MKLAKLLLVAPVLALAACSSSNNDASGMEGANAGQQFGGYSVSDLQSRYNTVYFAFDSYAVEGEYQQLLDAHAQYLNATPAAKVLVEGHADERGTPEYNIALGQRRADAVKSFLATKGANNVSTVSYGEEKPAVLGHDESAYSKNRRAVLAY
ncbi:peptidoglycan-associated lipoprotein Pal [Lonepinella sp. MS14437]|uniref:peptidoglycan-associated lipoprotein Pal n=1 Tax=unclassified Lonepinella TaxID=2642006 RepID=UPI0036DC1259